MYSLLFLITHTHIPARVGDEQLLLQILTPINVNCHASDGRRVSIFFVSLLCLFDVILLTLSLVYSSSFGSWV